MCSRHGIRFLILGKKRPQSTSKHLLTIFIILYISDTVFNYLLAYRIAQIA